MSEKVIGTMTPDAEERVPVTPDASVTDIHLPRPTVWPAACALAISLLLFGLITSLWFTAFGVALLAVAIAGWIGESRNDPG